MPVGTLAPSAVLQVFDANGDPLAGAQLFSTITGTATPTSLFHDVGLTTPWTNPAIADAGGFFVGIYMASTPAQKWILKDSLGVTQWTVDPVTAVNAGSTGIGSAQFTFGGASSSPVTVAAYVSGATFDKLQPGTGVYAVDSATLSGTFVIRGTGMVSGGTMTVAIMDLSSGAPDTPLATMTFTSLTGEVATSGAITFGLGGSTRLYGIKAICSGGFTGFVWGIELLQTA